MPDLVKRGVTSAYVVVFPDKVLIGESFGNAESKYGTEDPISNFERIYGKGADDGARACHVFTVTTDDLIVWAAYYKSDEQS